MAEEVLLPQWSMEMTEGVVLGWLKKEGDFVQRGDPLAEIETDKLNTELESPASGVLLHILVQEGETARVGNPVAIIAAPGEVIPRPAPIIGTKPVSGTYAISGMSVKTSTESMSLGDRGTEGMRIVPAARRLAREHGIDLTRVQGTGPGGRIVEDDVRRHIEAGPLGKSQVIPLTGLRKTIAARMLQSVQTMAQAMLHTETDVTEMEGLRQKLSGEGQHFSPLVFVIKAVARALREHPRLNSTLTGDQVTLYEDINLGVATSVPDGLVVPVVRQAGTRTLNEVAGDIAKLAEKARQKTLTPEDVTGGTFTISNLGRYRVDDFVPIINPPQVAILGVGRVSQKPALHLGSITVRSFLSLTLVFDHRALDGVPSAEFLESVCRYLEEPAWMVSEVSSTRRTA
jgi:pyruvate dehydrogenase E2 component (dihydrolipoamide acetyltransferase)